LSPDTTGRVLWPLQVGRWTVEAATTGERARVNFVVRGE